jgi:hypothetical protein
VSFQWRGEKDSAPPEGVLQNPSYLRNEGASLTNEKGRANYFFWINPEKKIVYIDVGDINYGPQRVEERDIKPGETRAVKVTLWEK